MRLQVFLKCPDCDAIRVVLTYGWDIKSVRHDCAGGKDRWVITYDPPRPTY